MPCAGSLVNRVARDRAFISLRLRMAMLGTGCRTTAARQVSAPKPSVTWANPARLTRARQHLQAPSPHGYAVPRFAEFGAGQITEPRLRSAIASGQDAVRTDHRHAPRRQAMAVGHRTAGQVHRGLDLRPPPALDDIRRVVEMRADQHHASAMRVGDGLFQSRLDGLVSRQRAGAVFGKVQVRDPNRRQSLLRSQVNDP